MTSTHVLIIDTAEDEERIECSGVDPTCEGWNYCDQEHSLEDEEAVADSGPEPHTLHGRAHMAFEEGLCVPTGRCILVDLPEVWQDNYRDDLAPGRFSVDFVFEDERTCYLTVVPS